MPSAPMASVTSLATTDTTAVGMQERRGLAHSHRGNAYSHCVKGENGQKREKGEHCKKGQCWRRKRGTINCPPNSNAGVRRTRGGRGHVVKVEHRDGVRLRGVFVGERLGGVFTALKTAAVFVFLVGGLPSVDGGRCAFTQVRRILPAFCRIRSICTCTPGAHAVHYSTCTCYGNYLKTRKFTIRDKKTTFFVTFLHWR